MQQDDRFCYETFVSKDIRFDGRFFVGISSTLCRPELAPGNAIADARENLAVRAARLLEAQCSSGLSLERL